MRHSTTSSQAESPGLMAELSTSTSGGFRVLVVSGLYPRPDDPTSGIFIHRQVAELRALGVDARVLCPVARDVVPVREVGEFTASLDAPHASQVDDVPVLYVPYRHVPHQLSTRLEARFLVRDARSAADDVFGGTPDLVHGHWLFPIAFGAVTLASDWGVPSVVSARGSDVHRYPRENRGFARFARIVLRRADRVVAVSRSLSRQIVDLADEPVPVSVVRNGVDLHLFCPASETGRARRTLGLPEAGVGIVSVARLTEEKGVGELFEAFLQLAQRREDVWLALVGDGPLRAPLRSAAGEKGFADRVFLPGRVAPDEVPGWMQACDVFALPSHAEGLPNVVLEAMACGLPVVATEVGGIPEVVDRNVGRLVPPRRTDVIAECLEELAADPALRSRLGTEARRRVEEGFTWRRSAEELVGVYRGALEGNDQYKDDRKAGDRLRDPGAFPARETT